MKLTKKCLIDFRSWLGENHNIRMWEFDELPEFVQNAYIVTFLLGDDESGINYLIEKENEIYNTNFQKELDNNLHNSN